MNAEVISVLPNKVKISVDDLKQFETAANQLKVGSYLRISDSNDVALIAIIDSFLIEALNDGTRKHILEATPLGVLSDGKFQRGGDSIAIPPKKVEPAKKDEITAIYNSEIDEKDKFCFSKLAGQLSIEIPVEGNKFFNKHIGIVGSTGSGKSTTIASIIQNAVKQKNDGYSGLNNSHIIIYDIHSEYNSAFPSANSISIDDLILPYWLLNSDELEELFLESGDHNNYNQASVLRSVITANKRKHNPDVDKVFYDSPLKFDIEEVVNCLHNLTKETRNAKADGRYMIVGECTYTKDAKIDASHGVSLEGGKKYEMYFTKKFEFHPTKSQSVSKGSYADGTLDKFLSRISSKYKQERLNFIFGSKSKTITFEETVKQFLGYKTDNENNVTILDLSGVPFEVLSITVSLISRLLFDFGYHYKKYIEASGQSGKEIPILLVLEEAHKYVPKSDLARFKSSKTSIERIAKEGRKYGVTLLISSQRPSEISETIFSQCSNFLAMRLTNPDDQSYVRRMLPDTFGNLTTNLSSLRTGEALLMGDAASLPSLVKIDLPDNEPSSRDIKYLREWKKEWEEINFSKFTGEWLK